MELHVQESDSLDAIYAEIPAIRCKRKCQEACGPVVQWRAMSAAEEARLGLFRSLIVEPASGLTCELLNGDGLCSAYSRRPLICRLWGVVDSPLMRCPHGCEPERWLTDEESKALLARAEAVTR